MPIYEYDCPSCGRIEIFQKMSDAALEECPQCLAQGQHIPVHKVISQSAFILKGTGWYKTDYSSSSTNGKRDSHAKPSTATSDTSKKADPVESKPSSAASDDGTKPSSGSGDKPTTTSSS